MAEVSQKAACYRRVTAALDGFISAFPTWGLLFVALGWAPGISLWQFVRRDSATFSIGSKGVSILLSAVERREALLWGAVSLALLGVVYLAAFLWKRRRDPSLRYDRFFRLLNGKLLVLLTLPGFAAIFGTHFEGKHDVLNLSLIALTATIFCAWVYSLLGQKPADATLPPLVPATSRISKIGPWVLVLSSIAAYGAVLSHLSIIDHRNLNTANWDLGIYDNIFWNSANGDFLGCSFCRLRKHYSAHFDPILWMLTPIYRISPRAETLLILQSFWLALGGIPLFLYARRLLGSGWWATAIVTAYLLMPALHGANLYDFHSLALLIPTAIFAIYFLDSRRFLGYWVSLAVLLITREDMSLLACFIGLYAWFTGSKKTALATIVVAVAYLGAVKLLVMPPGLIMDSSSNARSFARYYEEAMPYAEEGVAGLVITLLTDPISSLAVLFQEKKLIYFATLLLPLLFLPLVSGKKRILMLYGLVFIGLVTRKYVYSAHFQYSSLLLPFLALSVADAIVGLRQARWLSGFGLDAARTQRALLLGIVVSSALMGAEYGVLASNSSFRAGWSKVEWTQSEKNAARYAELQEVIAQIPPRASITTDSRTGPHVTNRPVVLQWPNIYDADYLLFSGNSTKDRRSKKFKELISTRQYEIAYESKAFLLARRIAETPQP